MTLNHGNKTGRRRARRVRGFPPSAAPYGFSSTDGRNRPSEMRYLIPVNRAFGMA